MPGMNGLPSHDSGVFHGRSDASSGGVAQPHKKPAVKQMLSRRAIAEKARFMGSGREPDGWRGSVKRKFKVLEYNQCDEAQGCDQGEYSYNGIRHDQPSGEIT